MKKALGGCLVVALLLAGVGGGAAWWFVLRPAWNAGSQFVGAATQWAQLAQMDAKVRNRAPFMAPADGRIPVESLSRFLAVQQTLKDQVGGTLETLSAKYRQIEGQSKTSGQAPGVETLMGAYGDLFGVLQQAKQAEVDAINAQNLTLAEYRWIRERAYAALMADGLPGAGSDPVLVDNARAVAPYKELLGQTAVVAWLGL